MTTLPLKYHAIITLSATLIIFKHYKNLREKPDEEEKEEVRLEPLGALVHDQFQFFSNHIFGGNQGILLT